MLSSPCVRDITEAFVRTTFFGHFVGGDTAEGTLPLLRAFRRANKGAILAYSVEVDPSSVPSHTSNEISKDKLSQKQLIKEIIHSIDVAASFEDALNGGRRTWVALKLTALLPNAQALTNLSKHIVQSRALEPDQVPFPGCPRSSDLDVILAPTSLTPLTEKDTADLRELYSDIHRVCEHAQTRGVKIIIDAEWSWYEPAICAIALALMREFNTLSNHQSTMQPLIYTTFQAYLRRTPSHLALALADARRNNYSLGVKLVRGAYHPYEIAAHKSKETSMSISPDELPPVWEKKEETDRCYDNCVKVLINGVREDLSNRQDVHTLRSSEDNLRLAEASRSETIKGPISHPIRDVLPAVGPDSKKIPSIGILFGTHNWESSKLILRELERNGLAESLPEEPRPDDGATVIRVKPEVVERVAIGQLFGMSDDLTQYLVDRTRTTTPFIIKYVPYGGLREVMPYLSRRAVENKSVLGEGKTAEERRRAGRALWKRITFQI
ncbi:hypothetical protein Agabi119p4_999 [Agaricus bisporus var. burnettii]|uniref:Proline dehydrogenase n=1 Tax=Agaricus bisporus var. burnettii TaxID=192524 RepID=A0A8H7FBT2_AGABI|nr:hypothetical protein Agabi119p4_999 [Agaricus bisporus var. burnettii]